MFIFRLYFFLMYVGKTNKTMKDVAIIYHGFTFCANNLLLYILSYFSIQTGADTVEPCSL